MIKQVETFRAAIANNELVGSYSYLTNQGGLVHAHTSVQELEELSNLLQLQLTAGILKFSTFCLLYCPIALFKYYGEISPCSLFSIESESESESNPAQKKVPLTVVPTSSPRESSQTIGARSLEWTLLQRRSPL